MQDQQLGSAAENKNLPKEPAAVMPQKGSQKKKKKRIVKWVVLAILLLAVVLLVSRCFGGKSARRESPYIEVEAVNSDIHVELSGSGTLEPADSYTVMTLISGEIMEAPFEEGDTVEKDQILYQVDGSDLSKSIERAELALEQSQTNYTRRQEALDDLQVKAPEGGTVVELLVDPGDKVTAGQLIARVEDRATMTLVVPFPADDAAQISVGRSAQVTLDSTFETLTGTVTKVSGADQILPGNRMVRNVTIELANPGALTPAATATATVGDFACTAAGTLTNRDEAAVMAPASGDVVGVAVKEGDRVKKDQVLLSIQSNEVADMAQNAHRSLRDAELSLENQYDQLENYTIKSPIQGTVVEKNYKTGDTLESGKVLCTVYDLSYLSLTLYVDELDIGQLQVGQSVDITADAVPGRHYVGQVTTVSIKGTTASGVTTYPVTIRIDETEGLLPGMNVDCNIQITTVENVVCIPAEAVKRGEYVLVKSDEKPDEEDSDVPEGFVRREIAIGVSDGDKVEVRSGLKAGDVVTYIPISNQNDFWWMMGSAWAENMPMAMPGM